MANDKKKKNEGLAGGRGESERSPFIEGDLRPDLTIDLDTKLGDLTMRELTAILSGTGAPVPVFKALKDAKDRTIDRKLAKDAKDAKDRTKDRKDGKDLKDTKDRTKDQKDMKDVKDVKDRKEGSKEDAKELKELWKDSGDGFGFVDPGHSPGDMEILIARITGLEAEIADLRRKIEEAEEGDGSEA